MADSDLNADLGEGFGVGHPGDDAAMLGIVSRTNVACGFHAGDPAGHCRYADMESVCAHGDSPGAVQIATTVRDQLKAAGALIRPCC